MIKIILTLTVTAFGAGSSLGVSAGQEDPVSKKDRETMREEVLVNPDTDQGASQPGKGEKDKYRDKPSPVSKKDRETMREEVSTRPGRDQSDD
ncbi:MAG: hypothetical protein H0X43_14090 [Nitrosospira sp.]|nr:hypothetical protein [Nitrosospira sp.]